MTSKSWFSIPSRSHFSLANLPFGIITLSHSENPRPAVAIGDFALHLGIFTSEGGFSGLPSIHPYLRVFEQPTLNEFAALGRPIHGAVRNYLQDVFALETRHPKILKDNESLQKKCLFPLTDVVTHLPLKIGDYTDFFTGLNHAYNCGVLLRGSKDALPPNYKHLPVGYHGRASSVVVSGTLIRRPWGQILENPTAEPKVPIFAPSRRLDMELELGAFVCRPNKMGEPIPVGQAEESLFGVVLMNDWSARDIQAWEYVPLGPFNAKNFGTTVSPWVVLADALEPFMTMGLANDTELLPYLREKRKKNVYNINLEVDIRTASGTTTTITRTNSQHLLFSFPQMLAHHSVTGCPMQVGDLLGSGTISGTEPGTEGSLLEQCSGGKTIIKLNGNEERTFLADHDTVTIRGWAGGADGELVGFGECVGSIEPANKLD